jgi:outer membrane protein assembly factor BamB
VTRAILALIITLGTAALLRAEQWPKWRGPSSNGVSRETNPPVRWSKAENITWRVAPPALSGSTPIIWNDRGLLNVGEGPNLSLWAVDRTTGAPIWKKFLAGGNRLVKAGPVFELLAENDLGEYTLSSPAISDGQIFIRTDKALYAVGKRIQSR